jgi:S1-C subfamily serine protease
MAGKKVSHPALGVSVTDAENGGALVSSVTANSAAAKAGLQQGDVITSVERQGDQRLRRPDRGCRAARSATR